MAMSASNTVSVENPSGHGTLRGRLSDVGLATVLAVTALNELPYSELLAVKRTLGASHESRLIQLFRQIQNGGA